MEDSENEGCGVIGRCGGRRGDCSWDALYEKKKRKEIEQ